MAANDQKEFGRRVAFLRKRLGYSQAEFARKVDRSETWLSQVERGVRRIDRMSVLERLAEALDVPIDELAPTEPMVVARGGSPTPAGALALTMASNGALRAVVAGSEPVDLEGVESRTERVWEFTHASDYEEAANLVEDLIVDVELVERQVSGAELVRARRAKARAYFAAAAALSKLGETGAAWVAIDRATSAAEAVGDPLTMAEGAFRLAITFQAARRYDLATRVADTAADAISELAGGEDPAPAAVSIFGALHLQLAVAAARTGDADGAYRHLETAHAAANRIGEGRNDFDTEFGPANVDLHEVSCAVALGDAGRALRVAQRADGDHLSAERRARLLIDVASANAQLRNTDAVVAALAEGARIAPQQIATHSRARELITDLVREHGSRDDVQALAEHATS
jgi:transcriptional regulator with XRE-family HTH domain